VLLKERGYWDIQYPKEGRAVNREYNPLIFGTVQVQDLLYQIHHPEDCDNAKYAIISSEPSGIGSEIHVLGLAFSAAVEMRRIAIFSGTRWATGDFCKGDNTWSCYFVPLSSKCTPTEEDMKHIVEWSGNFDESTNDKVLRFGARWSPASRTYIPTNILPILECSPFNPNHYYFFWRIQASTYMMRPNRRTLDEIARLRTQVFEHSVIPQGTINIHVRHGDKKYEMRLHELPDYMVALERMISSTPTIKPQVFLSSEDPKVIEDARAYSNITFYYTSEERKNQDFKDLISQGSSRFLLDLVNLNLALECDGHIGTFGSNWNRLIVELHSTIGYCAGCPYIGVDEQCSSVLECAIKGLQKDFKW